MLKISADISLSFITAVPVIKKSKLNMKKKLKKIKKYNYYLPLAKRVHFN